MSLALNNWALATNAYSALIAIISLPLAYLFKVFYSSTNITLPLLRTFGEHSSVSQIFLFCTGSAENSISSVLSLCCYGYIVSYFLCASSHLTFTTPWVKIAADDKLGEIFPRKQDLTFHANCLQKRQFA